jgi:hypothetical protein
MRETLETEQRGNANALLNVDCTIFEKHGAVALEAFSAKFASTRDRYAYDIKQHCIEQSLARVPPLVAARAQAAKRSVVDGMLQALPIPEGTMFQGEAMGAADSVLDVLLAPEHVRLSTGERELEIELRKAPQRASVVAQYLTVRDAALPSLAAGVCATRAAHGSPAPQAECERMAKGATNRALASWMSALRIGGW